MVLHSSLQICETISSGYDLFLLQNLKKSPKTENSYVNLDEKAVK